MQADHNLQNQIETKGRYLILKHRVNMLALI